MASVIDFSDAAAVRELAAAGERLVRLEFPEGLGSLYCQLSALFHLSSPAQRPGGYTAAAAGRSSHHPPGR